MNLSSMIDWMDLLIFVLAIFGTIGVIYAGFQLFHEGNIPHESSPTTTNKNKQSFPPENKATLSHQGASKKPLKKSSPEKLIPDSFVDNILEQALEDELKGKTKTKVADPIIPTSAKTTTSKNTQTSGKSNTPINTSTETKNNISISTPKNTTTGTPSKKPRFANPKETQKKWSLFSFWKKDKDYNTAELLGEIMPPVQDIKTARKQVFPLPELIAEKLTLRSPESINLTLKVKGNKLVYRKLSYGSYNELKIKHQPTLNKFEARRNEYPTGNSLVFSINGENVISKTYQFTIFYGDMAGNVFSQQVAGLGKEYPIVDQPQQVI